MLYSPLSYRKNRTTNRHPGRRAAAFLLIALSIALSGCSSSANGDKGGNAAPSEAIPSSDYSKPAKLLIASTDGTDDLYKDLNADFTSYWKENTGQDVSIEQSAAPSSKQLEAINNGQLKADLAVLGVGTDLDAIQAKGLIGEGWQQRYDYISSPYYTTVAFAVRSGNPLGIKEWEDLAKPGIKLVATDPKSYTDARWSYAGAWAYALNKDGDEEAAKKLVHSIYANAAELDADLAASEAKFLEQGTGDVLLTTEAEALRLANTTAQGKIEVIVPSVTLTVEPVVSTVDRVADEHGVREAAAGYADYLFTERAQTIASRHYYRSRFASVNEQFANLFPERTLLTVDDNLTGWEDLNSQHFADGGLFEQLAGKQ
ncbi:sulfate ABC transporter substrate-binding protein [Cohnella sp. AR92]|uniref:sulfate ABC transporter substrate-binding protein n=1 Tax=Cohnella sp. AR92 TaxID=648716 RepID=UPI000F8DC5FC|nr:sulfate ABC transporter substrate-binding protein [Cohnella sp. AR92]RUS46777.1 sulfate ABC transporter substrate-binding protein [Cohnella sp. AR92]